MSICVDSRRNSDLSGRLYHRGRPEPVLFDNTGQALIEMEKWCDRVGYPQPEVVIRKFESETSVPDDGTVEKSDKNQEKFSIRKTEEAVSVASEDLLNEEGNKGTFVVHIKYRQNASWQGQVMWAEKRQTCSFRSALELLKLIDSALDEEKKQDG